VNHLAHFYLAGTNDGLALGNYIADQVKGKQIQNFSSDVQRGIQMHRAIDHFTDTHSLVKQAIGILKPSLERYSSIAIDVIYDHFLAKHWQLHHNQKLEDYAEERYLLVNQNLDKIPLHSQHFYYYMVRNNILVNYKNLESIDRVFQGMSQRTRFPSKLHLAGDTLRKNYTDLDSNFHSYFELLKNEFKSWTN
jgi:acyl carrier protein phosphodiesterase